MPDVIVIGASMGGVRALKELVGGLPTDLPAAVLIVQHTMQHGEFYLPDILSHAGPLPAVAARDDLPLEPGRILVAPPDLHMLIMNERVRLTHGPFENRFRPSIDVLFRSAAVALGPRVAGVVLTGLLDDGAAGLQAIRRCGGVAVVQDPTDAEFPAMPLSALEVTDVDYVVPLAEVAPLLGRIAREPPGPRKPIPAELALEVRMAAGDRGDEQTQGVIGEHSEYACPECGGVLWKVDDPTMLRFRCRVGHAYTATWLLRDQKTSVESALWAAVRAMEEHASLLAKLRADASRSGLNRLQERYEERAGTAIAHARTLRELLLHMPSSDELVAPPHEEALPA